MCLICNDLLKTDSGHLLIKIKQLNNRELVEIEKQLKKQLKNFQIIDPKAIEIIKNLRKTILYILAEKNKRERIIRGS